MAGSYLENDRVKNIFHDKDLEAGLIGHLLGLSDRKSYIYETLGERYEHFAWEPYRVIYEFLFKMFQNGIEGDIVTINQELRKAGRYRKEYITAMGECMTQSRFAVDTYYLRALIEASLRRQGRKVVSDLEMRFDDPTVDVFDAIEQSSMALEQLVDNNIPKTGDNFSKDVDSRIEEIGLVTEGKKEIKRFRTGFIDLDSIIGGFYPQELTIIAARPSVGKTAFAINAMMNVVRDKTPAYFFSLEMGKNELISRMMSLLSGINSQKIREYKLRQSELSVLREASDDLKLLPIHLSDDSYLTLTDMRMRCKRVKKTKGLNVVFVDYMQLMHPPKAQNREREIGLISQGLKSIAKELDLSVVALSQFNRSAEAMENKEPQISDLRESGSIEQDADNVVILHRPEKCGIQVFEDKTPTKNVCEVIIAKQRNGPIGRLKLSMKQETYSFCNYMSEKAVDREHGINKQIHLQYKDDLYGDDDHS